MQKRRGFTLVELLVTMAIIGLLTGLLVTNVSRSVSGNRLADDVTLMSSKVEQIRLLASSTQQTALKPGLQVDPDSAYYALYFPASSTTSYDLVRVSADLNNGSCAISQLATNPNCLIEQDQLSAGVALASHPDEYIAFKTPVEELTAFNLVGGLWQAAAPNFGSPFLQLTFNGRTATVNVDNVTGRINATYE